MAAAQNCLSLSLSPTQTVTHLRHLLLHLYSNQPTNGGKCKTSPFRVAVPVSFIWSQVLHWQSCLFVCLFVCFVKVYIYIYIYSTDSSRGRFGHDI